MTFSTTRCTLAATLLLVAATPGPAPATDEAPAPETEMVVARYAGGEITQAEYDAWVLRRRRAPDAVMEQNELESLAVFELLLHEMASNDLGHALELELSEIEEKRLAGRYRQHVRASVDVSDEVIDARLAADDALRTRPRKIRLRGFFRRVPTDATPKEREALRTEVQAIHRELRAGADFDAIAKERSDSQTRHRGGRMGVAKPGQLPPALDEIVFALDEGELTEVLETSGGFHIFRCDKIVESKVIPVDEARERIAKNLRRKALDEAWEEAEAELRRAADPQYDLAAARSGQPDSIVLRFAGRELAVADARRIVRTRPSAPPLESIPPASLHARLDAYVVQTMAARKALELGLGDESERLTDAWKRRELLAAEAMRRRVAAATKPLEDDELRRYFEDHPARYTTPERFRLAIIRLPIDDAAEADAYRLATTITDELSRGATTFAAAATSHSRHPSAGRGGELGPMTRKGIAALGPDVFRAIMDLDVGQTTAPILQDGDLVLVKLRAHEAERPATFDESRERVERRLGNERVSSTQKEIESSLRRDLALVVVEEEGSAP